MADTDNSQNISITGSSGVSIGNIEHKIVEGDSIDMSGDFRGANVNVKSTLENASQLIGSSSNIESSVKEELQMFMKQLNDILQQVPPEKADEAEAVATIAEELVEKAAAENPNSTMVRITGEGLKQAAQNIAEALPSVLSIATKIVATVATIL